VPRPSSSARKVDESIAMLPFQNLSDEKENAYFADGIQDDILTNRVSLAPAGACPPVSVFVFGPNVVTQPKNP